MAANRIIRYSPNDYSPEYELEIDGNCDFVRLVAVREHSEPGAKEIPIDPHYEEYIRAAWPTSWYCAALRGESS